MLISSHGYVYAQFNSHLCERSGNICLAIIWHGVSVHLQRPYNRMKMEDGKSIFYAIKLFSSLVAVWYIIYPFNSPAAGDAILSFITY